MHFLSESKQNTMFQYMSSSNIIFSQLRDFSQ